MREVSLINLWQRCNRLHALPCSGGILEQPEWIMREMDTIAAAISDFQNQQQEQQDMDLEKERRKMELQNGRSHN
jgi:hypothetical protein